MSTSNRSSARSHINPLAGVRNWNAQSRVTTKWEGLHMDTCLWFPDGDLFVFLFEKGESQRKPSFHVRMSDLRSRHFEGLIEMCIVSKKVNQPMPTKAHPSSLRARMAGRKTFYELYLPPPADHDNIAALDFHITTRNFFAWMYDVPIVGKSLGRSLVAILERMNRYRPYFEQNRVDLMTYLERQGYYDFRMCPDHSLAALHLAETFEMRNVWKNAFAHCVGMYDLLHASPEYESISETTRAMITRSNVDMDTHLDRVVNSIGTFFEEFTAGSIMGLGAIAKSHLDRFRSFLITVHIERHGFWPPPSIPRQDTNFPRDALMALYLEFRCLYQFLVDPEYPDDALNVRPRPPGIDVEQMTRILDEKHGFEPLPHCMPLVPQAVTDVSEDDEGGSMSGFGARKQSGPWRRSKNNKIKIRKALWKTLAEATNYAPETYATLIVRRYVEFEREILIEMEEEKVRLSLVDGRRIRWLLIYGILQVLISVLRAPNDVSDMDDIEYPLCCKIPSSLPWERVPEWASDSGTRTAGSEGSSIASGTSKSVKFEVDKRSYVQQISNLASSVSTRQPHQTAVVNGAGSAFQARAAEYQRSAKPNAKAARPPSLLRLLGKKSTIPQFTHEVSLDGGVIMRPPSQQSSSSPLTPASIDSMTSSSQDSVSGFEKNSPRVKSLAHDLSRTRASPSPLSSSAGTTPSASITPSLTDEEVPGTTLPPESRAPAISATTGPPPSQSGAFFPSMRETARALMNGTPVQSPSNMVRSEPDQTVMPDRVHERGRSTFVSGTPLFPDQRLPRSDHTARSPLLATSRSPNLRFSVQPSRRSHSQPPIPSIGYSSQISRGPQQLQIGRSTPRSPSSTSRNVGIRSASDQLQNDIDTALRRSRSPSEGRIQLATAGSYRSITPTTAANGRTAEHLNYSHPPSPFTNSPLMKESYEAQGSPTQSSSSNTPSNLLRHWKITNPGNPHQSELDRSEDLSIRSLPITSREAYAYTTNKHTRNSPRSPVIASSQAGTLNIQRGILIQGGGNFNARRP